jgi:hypothetical protein
MVAPTVVDADRRDYLQTVADESVFEATDDWVYPPVDEALFSYRRPS